MGDFQQSAQVATAPPWGDNLFETTTPSTEGHEGRESGEAQTQMNAPLHGEGSPLGPITPDAAITTAAARAAPARPACPPPAPTPHPATDHPAAAHAQGSPYGLSDWRPGIAPTALPPSAAHDATDRDHLAEQRDNNTEEHRQQAAHTDTNPVGRAIAGPRTGRSVGDRLFNEARSAITHDAPAGGDEDPDLDRIKRQLTQQIQHPRQ